MKNRVKYPLNRVKNQQKITIICQILTINDEKNINFDKKTGFFSKNRLN